MVVCYKYNIVVFLAFVMFITYHNFNLFLYDDFAVLNFIKPFSDNR